MFFLLGLITSTFAIVMAAMLSANSSYKDIEKIYYDNTNEFNNIYSYMKNTYSKNTEKAELDLDDKCLKVYIDKNVRIVTPDEPIIKDMQTLHDKYQPSNSLYVFTSAASYFDDNGNMMMYLYGAKKKLGERSRNYCLVYVDDGYNGYYPNYLFNQNNTIAKPFDDKWYIWSYDSDVG